MGSASGPRPEVSHPFPPVLLRAMTSSDELKELKLKMGPLVACCCYELSCTASEAMNPPLLVRGARLLRDREQIPLLLHGDAVPPRQGHRLLRHRVLPLERRRASGRGVIGSGSLLLLLRAL